MTDEQKKQEIQNILIQAISSRNIKQKDHVYEMYKQNIMRLYNTMENPRYTEYEKYIKTLAKNMRI